FSDIVRIAPTDCVGCQRLRIMGAGETGLVGRVDGTGLIVLSVGGQLPLMRQTCHGFGSLHSRIVSDSGEGLWRIRLRALLLLMALRVPPQERADRPR